MADKQELLLPGNVYHIYNHANGDDNLFRCEDNYRYFLEKYTLHVYPVVETFAYCLMPNHFHLMVKVRKEEELQMLPGFETLDRLLLPKAVSKKFSNLFNGYTQAYNKMYDRKGSLFMDSFKRKVIENQKYFTQLITYIHYNPIHHGLVKDIHQWQYSSIHAYLLDKSTRINTQVALSWFGDKNGFLQFHQSVNVKDISLAFDY